MAESVAIDMREITVTPVFRYDTIEDINASEREGRLVKKVRQLVEVRFAGSRNYSPVFPVNAFWKRENGRVVTYAERWAEQYRNFLEGHAQEAAGTPLEMLKAYGIKDSQLSLCKALKIYSVEALHHLEGDALKSLQMAGNDLKKMARDFMADREAKTGQIDEIEKLKAEIAALKLAQAGKAPETTEVLVPDPKPEEIEAAIEASDRFEMMEDADLKAFIKEKSGQAPRGTPSREFLLSAARELA